MVLIFQQLAMGVIFVEYDPNTDQLSKGEDQHIVP